MNFLPATLRRAAGQVEVELRDGARLPAPQNCTGEDGQAVLFGTRPEHLTLVNSGGIAAQVAVVEPTGADTFVACRHQGQELAVVFRDRFDFTPGHTVHLQPDARRTHVFDAGTGRRLAA